MSQPHKRKMRGKHYYKLKVIKELVPESPETEIHNWDREIHKYNKTFFKLLDAHAKAYWSYKISLDSTRTAIIRFKQNGCRFEYELKPKDFCRFTSRGIEVMLCRLINQVYFRNLKSPNNETYQEMKALLHLRCVTRHVAESVDMENRI